MSEWNLRPKRDEIKRLYSSSSLSLRTKCLCQESWTSRLTHKLSFQVVFVKLRAILCHLKRTWKEEDTETGTSQNQAKNQGTRVSLQESKDDVEWSRMKKKNERVVWTRSVYLYIWLLYLKYLKEPKEGGHESRRMTWPVMKNTFHCKERTREERNSLSFSRRMFFLIQKQEKSRKSTEDFAIKAENESTLVSHHVCQASSSFATVVCSVVGTAVGVEEELKVLKVSLDALLVWNKPYLLRNCLCGSSTACEQFWLLLRSSSSVFFVVMNWPTELRLSVE